jgi:uncharacterized protein YegL
MSAVPTSAPAVTRIIEGITAMCLGSADNVIWIEETDAAAFSDGEHLYLPTPLGIDEDEYGLLLALALREVARIWHSTPERFDGLDADVLTYCVVMEEVRLQMVLARTFRGAPAIFGNAAAIVCAEGIASLSQEQADEEQTKALLVWAAAHAATLNAPSLHEGLERFGAIVRPRVGDARVEQATLLAATAGTADSTQAAIDLGMRTWASLHPQKPSGEGRAATPSAGNGEAAELSTGADGGGADATPATAIANAGEVPGAAQPKDGGDSGNRPSEADGRPEASAAEEPEPVSQDDTSPKPAMRGPFDPVSDSLARLKGHPHAADYRAQAAALRSRARGDHSDPREVSEAGQAMLAALLDEPDADRGLLATTAGLDVQGEPAQGDLTSLLRAGEGSPQRADQAAGRLLLDAIPARLVTVLLRELQDVRRKPFQHSVTGPRLVAAKLWRLSRLGDTRLFRKRTLSPGIDAAVSLILDRSASMKRNGFEQAVEVVQAFMLALRRIDGVKTSLDLFPGTGVPIEQVVAFGQNHTKAMERMRDVEPQGGTPTGSALARRLRQLLDVVAETKLILVITDGQPDQEEVTLLEAVLAQAAMFQVQVIGVGIGLDVGRRFPASISVRAVDELPGALAALFKEKLLRS